MGTEMRVQPCPCTIATRSAYPPCPCLPPAQWEAERAFVQEGGEAGWIWRKGGHMTRGGWGRRVGPATFQPPASLLVSLATVRAFTTPAATLRCLDGDSDGDVALFLSV